MTRHGRNATNAAVYSYAERQKDARQRFIPSTGNMKVRLSHKNSIFNFFFFDFFYIFHSFMLCNFLARTLQYSSPFSVQAVKSFSGRAAKVNVRLPWSPFLFLGLVRISNQGGRSLSMKFKREYFAFYLFCQRQLHRRNSL